jgi:hypothetical protein
METPCKPGEGNIRKQLHNRDTSFRLMRNDAAGNQNPTPTADDLVSPKNSIEMGQQNINS